MSAERKAICQISVVTDHDCGMYHIGEVGGSFVDSELVEHIRSYGPAELYEHMAYLQWQIFNAVRTVNQEQSGRECAASIAK